VIAELKVGPQYAGDGAVGPQRASRDGSTIMGAGMGDYQELAQRGFIFSGANQGPGGTTTTVGLATTYTGLVVSNPAGSGKNLVMLQAGIGVVGAPAALSTLGILAGFAAGGVTVHTTPLTPFSTLLSSGASGVGKVDSAATLVGSPFIFLPLGVTPITGATAQVVNPPVVLNVYDFKGSLVVPPGGYVAVYTSTVLSIIGGFTWAEVLI
jgi:hypothetical protein